MSRRVTRFAIVVVTTVATMLALAPASSAVELPPAPARFDYQLGGARAVPDFVKIVARDRLDQPLLGKYNICYVNGFQTQPDAQRFWRQHWRLVLKRKGRPVVDQAWGEWLLDIRTPRKRRALARIVGAWINGCAASGFQAVEFDNLDSFTRSRRLIKPRHANQFARRLVARAHTAGLAAAQKNRAEWDGRRVGFDFVVAEQCGQYDECGRYVSNYGSRVLNIEYTPTGFTRACTGWAATISIVYRDLALSPTGVRTWCA